MTVVMKTKTHLVVLSILLATVATGRARTITVDNSPPANFNSIQEAIDDANDGDVIIVAEGTYSEAVDFKGKNIVLTSANPTDSAIVRNTTINGSVCFRGTENNSCTLTGFNIDGSVAGFDWEIYPGGKIHTHATISYCRFENVVTGCGRLIWACDGTISNCVIANTSYLCLRPSPVPAIVGCHGLIRNCTLVNMSDGIEVLPGRTCTIQNCIVSPNFMIMVADGATLNISYSDIRGGLEWIFGGGQVNEGPGNIDTDPYFVRLGDWTADGDYHLKSQAGRWSPGSQSRITDDVTSPCIDAGDMDTPVGYEPFPNGGVVNMGAYGGTAEASNSYFGKPPCRIIVAGDINGDCAVDYQDLAIIAMHWLNDYTPDVGR